MSIETQQNSSSNYVEHLRSKRLESRFKMVQQNAHKILANANAVNCSLGFLNVKDPSFISDEYSISIDTLVSLQILGMRQAVFDYVSSNVDELSQFKTVEDEYVELKGFANGFTFRGNSFAKTADFVRSELEETATYKALSELQSLTSTLETHIASTEINFENEGLFLGKLLFDLGVEFIGSESRLALGNLPIEELNKEINSYIFEKSVESGKAVKTFMEGKEAYVFKTVNGMDVIVIKDSDNTCRIGYSSSIRSAYLEIPNQTVDKKALPFIETPTAQQMLGEFERVGIKLSEVVETIITDAGESDRYGSVATHFTREIAKIVNDKSRSLSTIFVEEPDLIEKINALNPNNIQDKTAKAIISIVKQLINRKPANQNTLALTNLKVSMRDGSCFDVAAQYELFDREGEMGVEKFGNVRMLTKMDQRKTFLNLDPVTLNGVEVPPGALFVRAGGFDSQEFALMRLTPYVDLDTNPLYGAFAPEVEKIDMSRKPPESPRLTNFFEKYSI